MIFSAHIRGAMAVSAAACFLALGCGSSPGGATGGAPGTGGGAGGMSGNGGSTTVVVPRADAGVSCTPIADVDCAKVGRAFDTVCTLGCSSLVMCDETTGPALESVCNVAKAAGDEAAAGVACLYTNPKSCEDLNSCLRACDR